MHKKRRSYIFLVTCMQNISLNKCQIKLINNSILSGTVIFKYGFSYLFLLILFSTLKSFYKHKLKLQIHFSIFLMNAAERLISLVFYGMKSLLSPTQWCKWSNVAQIWQFNLSPIHLFLVTWIRTYKVEMLFISCIYI